MKAIGAALAALACAVLAASPAESGDWTDDEIKVLRSLWIGSLPPLPPDRGNAVADDPRAADLGHRLFFDTRLSANGQVACATCHKPELAFTDGQRVADGIGKGTRNAPTVIGAAYSSWFFWDGRKDSQWSQALGPLESEVEHGMTRATVIDVVRWDPDYNRRYTALFGAVPKPGDAAGIDRAFANLGKAIAAYERLLVPGPSRFDHYVAALLDGREPGPGEQLTLDEIEGLRAFMAENQGQCLRCHSGPLFTNFDFHNIAVNPRRPETEPQRQGRALGIVEAIADPFNCLGAFSDAPAEQCRELRFAKRTGPELVGAFKTPTLRFVTRTGPYMHTGDRRTLEDAIWQYREPLRAATGRTELGPLTLTDSQFDQIEVFLHTLDGPIAAPEKYLRPPEDE